LGDHCVLQAYEANIGLCTNTESKSYSGAMKVIPLLSRKFVVFAALLGCTSSWSADVDYVKDVRPILREHCVKCHGAEKREGGLRLDIKKWVFEGGDSGVVLNLEKPEESELIYRVETDDEDDIMPPKGEHLTKAQVEVLKQWIAGGAVWPEGVDDKEEELDLWSFKPVKAPKVPNRPEAHPIDKMVQARLEQEKLKPSPRADDNTLLRRLSLDLTGLPPSLELQQKFVSDQSSDAYEKMVDHFLASPHFGEKWAMSWLDSARYADSDGYEKDTPRPHAWRWRDWVIDAINRDLPFDEFTVQQLAGDLLPGATQLVTQATGFHRNTLTNREGGVDREEFRVKSVVDRTNTTFSVWMGLTVGCAQCHTHKYDPITQKEYYQLYSFFNNANEKDLKGDADASALKEFETKLAAHENKLKDLEKKLEDARPGIEKRMAEWEQEQLQKLRDIWKPLESVTVTKEGENVLVLTGKTKLEKVTGLQISAAETLKQNAVVSGVEVTAQATETSGSLWLDSAAAKTPKGNKAVSAVLDSESSEGWTLLKKNSENSLILTTADSPGAGGWKGNPLKNGSQDGATSLLNVYYGSPVSGRGTVEIIRVFTMGAPNNTFTVYLLRPNGGKLEVIQAQQFKANGQDGEREFKLDSSWEVQGGDLFGHYGNGGPTFTGGSKDTIYYPLRSKPKKGENLEVAKFSKIPPRSYSLQYELKPASLPENQKFVKSTWTSDGATLSVRLKWQGKVPAGDFKVSVTSHADPVGGAGAGLDAKIVKILKSPERTKEQQQQLFDFYLGKDKEGAKLNKQLANHKKSTPKKPSALLHVMTEGNGRETRVHLRGNFMSKGDPVQSGTLAALPPLKSRGDRADRLDLARWIVDPANPLTSRVAVNQIWSELFGQGLVRTADDFGTQGELPSHPDLLDWLAAEFQRVGWSRKALIKKIVMSDTYQQVSQSRKDLNEKDPENRLLARQNRFRLSAELVRDQFLTASTLLNEQVGGPSFRPPLPPSVTRVQFVNKWKADSGDNLLRRGMYIHLQRNLMLPMLMTFDRPEAILSCSRRERSNTPLQALTLLNSHLFVQSSKELAKVLLSNTELDDSQRVSELFRRVISRPPSETESQRVLQLLKKVSRIYTAETQDAQELLGKELQADLKDTDLAKAAAWVIACRTVLNLDEAITRE